MLGLVDYSDVVPPLLIASCWVLGGSECPACWALTDQLDPDLEFGSVEDSNLASCPPHSCVELLEQTDPGQFMNRIIFMNTNRILTLINIQFMNNAIYFYSNHLDYSPTSK